MISVHRLSNFLTSKINYPDASIGVSDGNPSTSLRIF